MQLPEIQNYTEYLFRTALKKCGNLNEAEDLTQEVLLAALQYPKEISDIKSWLSMVLNHKYYDMLRRKYKLPTVCIDLIPEEAEPWEALDTGDRPDAACVRREVAYLADKYRTVIVRHYLNGEKVQDIADSLGVPKGTVLSRLSGGRKQMRRGFDEMESYKNQSFQPEKLEISCNGSSGFRDEPWSLVASDLMKQNILIAAYNKPLTVVEIARALGIPTAYVEQAVFDLAKSELMKQAGSKYFTDFMIKKPEQLLRGLDAEISLTEAHYPEILKNINDYLKDLKTPGFMSQLTEAKRKKLEYFFILHLFATAIYTVTRRIIPSKEEFPQRPDGGRWIATGAQYPQNFDYESYRFSKYCFGGMRGSFLEKFMNSNSIDLKVYDTQPDLNKYNRGPLKINDDNLAKLLYVLLIEIPYEHTGLDTMMLKCIPHLIECGILGSENGKPFVNLPIITPDEYSMLDKIRIERMHHMANLFEPWLRKVFPQLKIDIPKHLTGRIAEFRQYSCYAIPMTFIKKAIAEGDFNTKDATPPMVFVVDDQNKNLR